MSELTHINQRGDAHMIDVGHKQISQRSATAESYVAMSAECLAMITEGQHRKGDVLAVARIAGIQAAKKCSDLIPLCHPLMLSKIQVDIDPEASQNRLHITATCGLAGQTGVEMEALTAVSVAALTIYDMCKAIDKGMVIGPTQLLLKQGGKSGTWCKSSQS